MSKAEEVLAILRRESPRLEREFGVRRIAVFGSCAEGRATETSDIDIVVDLEEPIGLRFVGLVEDLETLLGRRVDVLTVTGLEQIRSSSVADDIRKRLVYG